MVLRNLPRGLREIRTSDTWQMGNWGAPSTALGITSEFERPWLEYIQLERLRVLVFLGCDERGP